jgi:alanyl-tRNA synthetase
MRNFPLKTSVKPLEEAIEEGAMALFGEKYGASVRTISIGGDENLSYELCGGTHVHNTADIGLFLITFEGSIAAGIRRIEAVTGEKAYQTARERMNALDQSAQLLSVAPIEVPKMVDTLLFEHNELKKVNDGLQLQLAGIRFENAFSQIVDIEGVSVLSTIIPDTPIETLRELTDRFRQKYTSGVIVLGSVVNDKPILIASVTDDLLSRGLHAGELIKEISKTIDGGGGGKANLAQAGGKNPKRLSEALDQTFTYVRKKLLAR